MPPSDAEIRAHPAYPRVVAGVRARNRVFWGGLPVFAVVAVYIVAGHAPGWMWFVVAALSATGVAGQLYSLRLARAPLAEIGHDEQTRERVWRLAESDGRPALLRRFAGG